MTSTRPGSPLPELKRLSCLGGVLLLAVGCGSSGSGGTSTGGVKCTPGTSIDCTGPNSCPGLQACQPGGLSYGTCNCVGGTSGGSSTGARATSTGTSSGGTTGGGTTTGGVMPTQVIGTAITPEGPNAGLVELSINATDDLATTPMPDSSADVTGTWNSGASTLTGTYNTSSRVLSLQSDAYNATFSGMFANGVISGEWVGGTYHWPFSLVPVPTGATGYAFCGNNGSNTESLGVEFFSSGGAAGGIEGPGANMASGSSETLTGTYSSGLASITSIGSFMLLTDSDGGLNFAGTGWSMSECE